MQTDEFVKLWAKLSKDYKIHLEQRLAPSLTEAQLDVLEVIDQHGKMKPSDLMPFLETSPPAITTLLDRMEKGGLITRVRTEEDRRAIWVELTEKGKEEMRRGMKVRDEYVSSVLSRISAHNQQLFIYLLGKITSA
ncbi:MarR family winged helix-turn-helix transcriptional regulator [Paenibacillus sp. MSJ-34]|uniref:MarR family winged helix-turn-helix transcriptional regulator n=1 Tax=Paenibacillus sp. MSJ-34 TaxID=2841529 RepID=UPI001C1000C4|nr:MarR family transcriptional regulator [Paenibacillus sp. MSJ-34]MBU5442698.1 MarR family transcriptional regulator [Paenibacillus sp. MSJ-34]